MSVDAVLFDIDGTLVDSNEAHIEVWARVFADAGHPVDRAAIASQIGKGGDLLVPTLLPGADEEETKRLSDAHGSLFKRDYLDRMRAFPHARDLVARVHASGSKVVLASSASQGELDHYCRELDLGELVDATTTIDDVEQSKPAPDIFAVAREKAGVAAERAIVLGDSPYDMEAARKCGIAAIGLRSGGFADDVLLEAGAGALYDDVADLLAQFDQSPLAR